MRIDPEHLITFSMVAELGSVSRAAQALDLSQPAVSGQLRVLQEQLGAPLYVRHGRGVRLTPDGHRLLPHAQAVARNVRDASDLAGQLRHTAPTTLHVGFSVALTPAVSSLLHLAAAHHLDLKADTRAAADLIEDVRRGTLDAALIVTSPQQTPGGLDTHLIGEDTLRLGVPPGHRLSDQSYVTPHALQGERLLWTARGSGIRHQAERLLDGAGLGAQPGTELGSLWAVLDGIRRGHGVGVLPASFLAADVQSGRVVSLGLEAPQDTVRYALITRPAPLITGPVRQLAELLTQVPLRTLLIPSRPPR